MIPNNFFLEQLLLNLGYLGIITDISLDNYGLLGKIFILPFSILLSSLSLLFNGAVGPAIILITIIVRLALLPLVVKQKKTFSKYKFWKEEKIELDKKYKDKTDSEEREKRLQEINNLSKKHNFRPFRAGCMPIVYQIIIIISLFQSIIREERFYEQQFLWLTLGKSDNLYILSFVIAASLFIQMKITNPEFIKLRYIFSILIGVVSTLLPAAISLYIVTTNIFLIIQYLILNKFFNSERSLKSYEPRRGI